MQSEWRLNRQTGLGTYPDLTSGYERSIVMYIRERAYEGIPGRLYRSTEEISRDIRIIEEKIRETEAKLSVHSIIDGLMESRDKMIDESILENLSSIIGNAERSLFHLERLREGMNYLEEELSEVRWLLKL